MSENAKSLIQEIHNYMEESMKKSYVFTIDEEIILKQQVNMLQKWLETLSDYELKRKDK